MADILYVIRHVPGSDAMSLRCASIIRQLQACGLSVDLMTTYAAPIDKTTKGLELGANDFFHPCKLKASQKVPRLFEMAFGLRASRWIDWYIDSIGPKAILFYGGTSTLVSRVAKRARDKNIKLYIDETDWFEPNSSMNIYTRIYYTLDNRRLKEVDSNLDGIIAISPFFYDHFSQHNKNVIFYPPCVEKLPARRESCDCHGIQSRRAVSFVYAGSLGPDKDILIPFAQALIAYHNSVLKETHATKYLLRVVGVRSEDMARELNLSADNLDSFGIVCYGRLPHDKTLSIVRLCDYGLLLRHPLLYAKAGFSTKAVEYLTNGLPLICNAVGGVDTLIEPGVDGFILGSEETDEQPLLSFLIRIAKLDDEAIARMSSAARSKAGELFLEKKYQDEFRCLLSGISK